MAIVKIGWLGDSQLDYAQYGMLRRRDDCIKAMDDALRAMVELGIKHVVHTGDFLQSNRPSPFTMLALQNTNRYLERHGIRVYVVSGNHDNARPHWVDVLKAGSAGLYGFQLIDRNMVNADGVLIYGLPNMSKEEFLKEEMRPADVLVMHQAVVEFINFPSSNALTVTELPHTHYRVIAIGDIHIYRIEPIENFIPGTPENPCLLGYAGATELNSETEPDDKFWVELNFDTDVIKPGDRLVSYVPHRIPTRPVLRAEINTEAEVNPVLDDLLRKAAALKNVDPREPIIFLHYNPAIPGLLDRFRTLFNPDTYIPRPKPVFRAAPPVPGVLPLPQVNVTVVDLLKSKVPETQDLYELAAQMFNPDMELEHLGGALDAYIERKLSEELPEATS